MSGDDPESGLPPARDRGLTRVARVLIALALGAGALVILRNHDLATVSRLSRLAQDSGPLAPALYILGYAILTVFLFPGSLLTIASGAVFGPVAGGLYSLLGASLGSVPAFLLSRFVAGERVRAWVDSREPGKLRALLDGVDAQGWRFVAFMRFAPILPFNVLNYALGLTRIRLLPYLLATLICMLPGALAYSYLGYAGNQALATGGAAVKHGVIALSLFGAIIALSLIVRRHMQR